MIARCLLRVSPLALALVVTAWGPRLEAEDVDAIVSRGVELRRLGRDSEALVEFQRAMKVRRAPRIQAQVALAEQALGLWTAAEDDLLEAMAQEADPWIKKNRPTLVKALSTIQTHLATLEIWGTPPGADVFVNEKPVGKLPLKKPVRVSGDSVVLRVHADGYLDSMHAVRVPSGETVREHVELIAVPPASVAQRPRSETRSDPVVVAVEPPVAGDENKAASTGATAAAGPTAKDQSPETPPSSSSRLRPFAWAAGVGAVGGLALGVVETFVAINRKNAFNNHTVPDPNDPSNPINDCGTAALSAACKPLQEQYNRARTLAIVGYAVGGALAIGSVVLFALSSTGEGPRATALACLPDPAARGLSCALRF